jgi:hypothetical protein
VSEYECEGGCFGQVRSLRGMFHPAIPDFVLARSLSSSSFSHLH